MAGATSTLKVVPLALIVIYAAASAPLAADVSKSLSGPCDEQGLLILLKTQVGGVGHLLKVIP